MIRVLVSAPDAPFGQSIYVVDSADDATVDEFGVLSILLPPSEQTTATMGSVTKVIAARRSRKVVFPHGAWTRMIIEDVVDD